MKINRIQHSLTSAIREISRYAATRRITSTANLSSEQHGFQHNDSPERAKRDDEGKDRPVITADGLHAQVRLLNITA
ncbi:MAG: hypothetical protein RIS36_352 [Pseudomonadota bacterium]|jgi:hypothetical protein